jgi:hypothetical protein
MLGVHSGMSYDNSRTAIGASLGTVFFLFIGVYVIIRIMIAFSGSFQFQLLPFAALIFGGGVGLFVALGSRNPSSFGGDRAGLGHLPLCHVLCHHQLIDRAAPDVGRVPGDRRHLRLYDARHADPGDLRVRRGNRPHNRRRRIGYL